jgi:hypothetical protein
MIFFDYPYYRICEAYMGTKDSSLEFAAVSLLSLIQGCYIMSIQMIIEIMQHDKSIFSKALTVGPYFVFLVINYIRYVYRETNNYKVMKERYNNERSHRREGILVLILYLVLDGL